MDRLTAPDAVLFPPAGFAVPLGGLHAHPDTSVDASRERPALYGARAPRGAGVSAPPRRSLGRGSRRAALCREWHAIRDGGLDLGAQHAAGRALRARGVRAPRARTMLADAETSRPCGRVARRVRGRAALRRRRPGGARADGRLWA